MYTLYIGNKNYSSWSLRPWVMMRELGLTFNEKIFPVAGYGEKWEEFRAFSPSGKVPCLHDGERRVWESIAIIEYLAEKHGGVWPEALEARVWARSAVAEMHAGFSTLRNMCGMNCGVRVKLNNIASSLQHDITRIDEIWREGLARFGGPYLAGDVFTAADAFFAPVVFRTQTYGLVLSEASMAYVRHMLALPSMADWYQAALIEPWREAEHEDECLRYGKLLQDLRR
jgi:glutathione S-transferase